MNISKNNNSNNYNIVNKIITTAKDAQAIVNEYSQDEIDKLILAIAWEVIKPETNKFLSEIAVASTGLGNVESKIAKNRRKTIGLLRDLQNIKTVGIISECPDKGIIEIARPVGVVAAIVPSTHPVATPLNKVINAIKCRNAIVIAPSPKGDKVCQELVKLINIAIQRVGGPIGIVQKLPSPISKEVTSELTRQADLVIATGSQNNVLRALQSGTPTLGVGVGNVPSIIDETADIKCALAKIKESKTFDYATSCSSENSLIVLDSIYNDVIKAFDNIAGVLLTNAEKQKLQDVMWDENQIINRNIVAKSAATIANIVGLDNDKFTNADILLVAETKVGSDYPFSKEKLSPILTIYKVKDFNEAISLTKKILINQGQGHSVSIHSSNQENILRLGLELPVCRVIVNQAHCFATGGSFDNDMPFSLSIGCGTWGNNVIDTNINYKSYLNITKIVKTIKVNKPSEESIFGTYWQKYDCK